MSLSNTAVPIYYGQFRDKVLRGEIPVCEEISMEMNRIDYLISREDIYYDDKAVEGWIKFCEDELTLTDGSDLVLLDTFKLWGEEVFGWYYFVDKSVYVNNEDGYGGRFVTKRVKKRLINKQYLIVGRGAAKSMYASCIQAYYLIVDPSTTQQITMAPTMKQAEEVMSPIRTAIIRSKGPVFKFMTAGSVNATSNKALRAKLASTKKGIENFMTGSILEIRPMSINKTQGSRLKVATVDEWLSGDTKEDVIGALEQGASKNHDYLIIATSSEGTVRNGPGDTIKMELIDILKGKYVNLHTSIFYYKLDDIKEVNDPSTWLKANPNLGRTVTYEAYQIDVERAENVPAARNDIIAKRFNIPMEGYTYFFTYEDIQLYPHPIDVWSLPCSMGVDLSLGDDFCAFTFLFPRRDGSFLIKTRCYITDVTYSKLAPAMRLKYDEFRQEGSLIIMDSSILDMMPIYDDLFDYIVRNELDVRCVGYDPYNAKSFIDRWVTENGEFGVGIVRQGRQTESVPLGEIKHLSQEHLLLFDQHIMQFTMQNAATLTDNNGNRKLIKNRNDEKIDSVSALLDAFIAYKDNVDVFD